MKINEHQLETVKACLEELLVCLEDAPVDFLGTGGIGSTPDKDEKEWKYRWMLAYMEMNKILKSIK